MDLALENALEALEAKVGIEPPFGAVELPPTSRFRAVLLRLRERLCPEFEKLRRVFNSDEADLVIEITNIIIAVFDLASAAATVIARKVALIGMKQFCANPSQLVQNR